MCTCRLPLIVTGGYEGWGWECKPFQGFKFVKYHSLSLLPCHPLWHRRHKRVVPKAISCMERNWLKWQVIKPW